MESRTRLAIGGMATVGASVAVVCAVAMTTSVALADSAGKSTGARPVVVPSSSASDGASPSAVPVPPQSSVPVIAPETVQAPEPEDVAAPPVTHSWAGEPSLATADQLVAVVEATGSWDAVYAWAQNRGWSQARTDAWVAHLDAKIADRQPSDKTSSRPNAQDAGSADRKDTLLPAQAGTTAERDQSGPPFGSKREQSRVPPD